MIANQGFDQEACFDSYSCNHTVLSSALETTQYAQKLSTQNNHNVQYATYKVVKFPINISHRLTAF